MKRLCFGIIQIRPLLQIILLLLFFTFFGFPAIQKFQKNKVMIVTSMIKSHGIEAPAITIGGMNPTTGEGWRNNVGSNNWADNVESYCSTESFPEKCIERNTFNKTETLKEIVLGFTAKHSLQKQLWTEDFTVGWMGRSYTLNTSQTLGPHYQTLQLYLIFDDNLEYDIYIHDPKYFVINLNPSGPPILNVVLDPKTMKSFYYCLVLIEVEELDLPEDPCNMDRDYNFQACVKESTCVAILCCIGMDRTT